MRRLPLIAALSLALDCAGAALVAGASPVCVSCSSSAAVTVESDNFVLAMGGGDGGIHFGGMHCGPGCGGGRGGMDQGVGGGMGASSGGMGGSLGGMGGFGGWNPFLRTPAENCPRYRQSSDRRRARRNLKQTELSQCPMSR